MAESNLASLSVHSKAKLIEATGRLLKLDPEGSSKEAAAILGEISVTRTHVARTAIAESISLMFLYRSNAASKDVDMKAKDDDQKEEEPSEDSNERLANILTDRDLRVGMHAALVLAKLIHSISSAE
jgi:hypothetical protein